MEVIDERINALVRQNTYSSKEAVITDAVRALLELKPGLKIEIAINLYKNNKVNLWKRNTKLEIAGTKEESKRRIKDALGA